MSVAFTFTVFFASFAFMVAKVNSSSGSWSFWWFTTWNVLLVTVKAIGCILPESEVLGSFDIEKIYKIKIKNLLIAEGNS